MRYSHEDVMRAAEDAVALFIEYRDLHGYPEDEARIHALAEVWEGAATAAHGDIEEMREWQARGEGGAS